MILILIVFDWAAEEESLAVGVSVLDSATRVSDYAWARLERVPMAMSLDTERGELGRAREESFWSLLQATRAAGAC
ncbi:hypothetical protein KC321_g11 [Hortaea werneckii]|nr:hypothetical protein KC321_g11 [Hortaea werneckii]